MSDTDYKSELQKFHLQSIIIAAIIVVITLVLFQLNRRRKYARRGVLLTGLCDSGKTLIFSQLIHGKFVNTQTSIKENMSEVEVNNMMLRVIDIPGHDRLRDQFFDKYKSLARGLVYVVDSVTVQVDIRDVAEFLYNIISDPAVYNNGTKLLILCNKQDMGLAKSSKVVRSMLEKELNTLRLTKSSQLESVDSKNKKLFYLGNEGKDFEFSHLQRVKVEFGECFANSKEPSSSANLEALKKWLAKIA